MTKTSGSGTCQEKFDYLTKAVKDSISYLINITLTMEGNLDEKIDQFSSPEEYLEYLSNHLEDFPKGPDINYKASYLDPSVANPSVMAYYIFTPIDDVKDNIIRVNGTSSAGEDTNSMYYTLAHEGFPGHMYQFTWYFSQDFNPIRHDVDMLGYTEGWAQYVEKIMLNRSPLNPLAQEGVAINTFAGYVVQAAADLAVNGLGYSEEDLSAWVGELGIGDASTAHTLYDAVIDMPGQILPYGYGMAKFWELRERTQSALGDDFNLEEFHLQLLTNGPRSFDIVEQDLEKYVESKGSKLPEKFTFFAHENSESTNPVGTILQYGSSHLKELILIGVGGFIVVLALMFVICHAILRLIFGKH